MVQRTLDLVCNSRNNWYWSHDSSRSKVDCLGSRKNQSSSCVKSSGASDLIIPVPPLSFCPSVKSYSRPTQNSKIIDSFSPKKKIVEAKEDGKIVPIYIEVKTTSSPVDVEFFVSANELEKSKELNGSSFKLGLMPDSFLLMSSASFVSNMGVSKNA